MKNLHDRNNIKHATKRISFLPRRPILGSSNSAANKYMYMMSKIWTNGNTIIRLTRKHCGKKEQWLVTSNFFFSQNVFKNCLLLMRQKSIYGVKG